MERYLPTGNEYISIPKLNETTAGIEDLTFLTMQYKGMLELRGNAGCPLIQPVVAVDGVPAELSGLHWSRDHYWMPVLDAQAGTVSLRMVIVPTVGERGFAMHFSVSGTEGRQVQVGLRGLWSSTWLCINEDKQLEGTMHAYHSAWNDGIVFDYRLGAPLFSFAPMCDQKTESEEEQKEDGIHYRMLSAVPDSGEVTFYWGFGFEEVASSTSAKEMLRHGYDWNYSKTASYLDARCRTFPTEKLTEIYNTNLFFCLFYATGITLDTEELTCMTSRSTRYYVSAAYWDRDVLLWAFPSILDTDQELAKEVLHYVFGRQRRNLGKHSRYIDGTLLEPGFELDELMAPVIALQSYYETTGDSSILEEENTKNAMEGILKTLRSYRHSEIALYETFLQPSDDVALSPYQTYDNALVWKSLCALAELYPNRYSSLSEEAEAVRKAVYQYCVVEENGKQMFAWSVDLHGHHDLYEEPPGSLQLLPYYGFCGQKDPIWQNTIQRIRSSDYAYSFSDCPIQEVGCSHAEHPWILSFGNSMLSGFAAQAYEGLQKCSMDNGIACESVNEITGECATGAAFATCAGFLCHAMIQGMLK